MSDVTEVEALQARVHRAERELRVLQEWYRRDAADPYRRARDEIKRANESIYEGIVALRKEFGLENSDGSQSLIGPIRHALLERRTFEELYERESETLRDVRAANRLLTAEVERLSAQEAHQ